jgi:Tfp pilus assembly protein PilZ
MGNSTPASDSVRVKLKRSSGVRLQASSVWNISLGGLFVELDEPLAFGEDLSLEIDVAAQSSPLLCEGFVVWSTKDSPDKAGGLCGVAVRLTGLGIADMRTIAARVGQEL